MLERKLYRMVNLAESNKEIIEILLTKPCPGLIRFSNSHQSNKNNTSLDFDLENLISAVKIECEIVS